jgi:tetratricopeptide (TPR) repeat protein
VILILFLRPADAPHSAADAAASAHADASAVSPAGLDAGSPVLHPTDAAVAADASARGPGDAGPARAVALDAGLEPHIELFNQANAAYRKKNFRAAAALAAQSIASRRTLKAVQLRAQALLAAGDFEPAEAAIDVAITMAPRSATAWYWKGKIVFARGDRDGARAAFEKSLEIRATGSTADEIRLILDRI